MRNAWGSDRAASSLQVLQAPCPAIQSALRRRPVLLDAGRRDSSGAPDQHRPVGRDDGGQLDEFAGVHGRAPDEGGDKGSTDGPWRIVSAGGRARGDEGSPAAGDVGDTADAKRVPGGRICCGGFETGRNVKCGKGLGSSPCDDGLQRLGDVWRFGNGVRRRSGENGTCATRSAGAVECATQCRLQFSVSSSL